MGLTKLFRNAFSSKNQTIKNMPPSEDPLQSVSHTSDNGVGVTREPPEIPEQFFIENEHPDAARPEQFGSLSGKYDLALLYKFIDQDLEKKGYEDALTNPDTQHMNRTIETIRNQLKSLLSRVEGYYQGYLRDIEFHIETRKQQNLLELVAELETHKAKIEDEKKTVEKITHEAFNDGWPCQNLILTYKRGFLNGFAAITYETILSKRNP